MIRSSTYRTYVPAPVYIPVTSEATNAEAEPSSSFDSSPTLVAEVAEALEAAAGTEPTQFLASDLLQVSGKDGHIMGNGNNGWVVVPSHRSLARQKEEEEAWRAGQQKGKKGEEEEGRGAGGGGQQRLLFDERQPRRLA